MSDPDDYRPDDTPTDPENITVPWDDEPVTRRPWVSLCGDASYQNAMGRLLVPFPQLAGCRECDMCGACETHWGCLKDFDHIAWYAAFAADGEERCGARGGPHPRVVGDRVHTCALPTGHETTWHRARDGNSWEEPRPRTARRRGAGHTPNP